MSARIGSDGLVRSTAAAGSAHVLAKQKATSPSSSISPMSSKYVKISDSSPSQKQTSSQSSLQSSTSLTKPPTGMTPSPSQNSSSSGLAASASSTVSSRAESSKSLKREESAKMKASDGTKRGLFGWIKHHITDMTDTSKGDNGAGCSRSSGVLGGGSSISLSMSSKSRGAKKKAETAASFARNNHLSDSMPSLVVQANAAEPKPAINVDTGGVKRRQSKTVASKTANDELCGSGRLQVPGSGRFNSSADRNRWSSYDIVGGAGSSTLLVAVEDTDETGADDAAVSEDGSAATVATSCAFTVRPAYTSRTDGVTSRHHYHHHLRTGSMDVQHGTGGGFKAHSVEAIHIAVEKNETTSNIILTKSDSSNRRPHQPALLDDSSSARSEDSSKAATDGISQLAPEVEQTSLATRATPTNSAVANADVVGKDEYKLRESLREKDECIEKALCVRKKLLAQLLDIPSYDFDSIAEMATMSSQNYHGADADQRELMLTLLIQADRLTVGISNILRLNRPYANDLGSRSAADSLGSELPVPSGGCSSSDGHNVSSSSASPNCSAEKDAIHLFLDVGLRLQSQLTALQDLIESRQGTTAQRRLDIIPVEFRIGGQNCLELQQDTALISSATDEPHVAEQLALLKSPFISGRGVLDS